MGSLQKVQRCSRVSVGSFWRKTFKDELADFSVKKLRSGYAKFTEFSPKFLFDKFLPKLCPWHMRCLQKVQRCSRVSVGCFWKKTLEDKIPDFSVKKLRSGYAKFTEFSQFFLLHPKPCPWHVRCLQKVQRCSRVSVRRFWRKTFKDEMLTFQSKN